MTAAEELARARTLLAQGRTDDAEALCRAVLSGDGASAVAHCELGSVLAARGRHQEAESEFREALGLQRDLVAALRGLVRALLAQGRAADAEALARNALAQDPGEDLRRATLERELAMVLRHQRRHAEALGEIERAYARAPALEGIGLDRADELQSVGRDADAVEAYRRVIAANPLDERAHRQLNHLLYRLGRDGEFLGSYDEAAAKHPGRALFPFAKAGFLLQAGRHDEAQESFMAAVRLMPGAIAPLNGLAVTLARKGEHGRALDAHRQVLRLAPRHAESWIVYCESLLRAREAQAARAAAEEAMALAPGDQGAIAHWSTALAALGDAREHWLNDYDNLVQVFELAPPEGFADMASFNRALAAELDLLHGGTREFLNQSLRGGTQTLNDLFAARHPLVERLRARIGEAVRAYMAALADDAAHPFRRRRRSDFAYAASWSSRLHDRGFHTNHVHPKGWISSAYYVALPDAVEDEAARQGWIKFGEPGFDAGLAEPIRRAVKPKAGKLVLFPSYMWHGTVPFRSQASRTTIAFDVVPR